MGPAACHTQGLPSLGSATLDFDGDHSFLFSKKRFALRIVPAVSKDTTSGAAREQKVRGQCGTLRRRKGRSFNWLPGESRLAVERRPRPHAAEMISYRRRFKTALMF
jgi:hypothetical protein